MPTEEREEHLFVVRVWRECTGGDQGWRGAVHHVSTGRRIVSADLNDITDFIRVRLAAEPDS